MGKPPFGRTTAVLVSVVALASGARAQTPIRHAPTTSAAPAVHAGNLTPLRLSYAVGHRVRYVQRTSQSVHGLQGAPANTNVTTSTMDFETVAVHPDGSADQRMRVAAMGITGDGIPASLRVTLTRGMTGATYEYTQDARGRVISRQPPTGIPEDLRTMAEGVSQSIDQLSPVLPEEPTPVGSSWHDHQTFHFAPGAGANLDMNVDVTYTLRQLLPVASSGVHPAVLGVTMTFSTPEGTNIQGMPLRGTGSTNGEMTLDLGHGCVTAARSTGSMTMHIAAAGHNLDIETQMENTLHTETPR